MINTLSQYILKLNNITVADIRKLTLGCEILLVKKEGEKISIRYSSSTESNYDDEIVLQVDAIDFKLISLLVE